MIYNCSSCSVHNCFRRDSKFPEFCLTTKLSKEEIDEVNDMYINNEEVRKLSISAAEIEGEFYGKITRVEEIAEFAKRIGAKKIGIATCVGLLNESKIFAKFLEHKGLEPYAVVCKVGGTDKTEIGIPEEKKLQPGCHDSLFMKYSEAPVTTLITKDRVLGHNPAASLYTSRFYYKKLFE